MNERTWVIGVDIGQAVDYTAASILQINREFKKIGAAYKLIKAPVDCLYIDRMHLGQTFGAIIDWVKFLYDDIRDNHYDDNILIVYDATGVGRPFGDYLKANTGLFAYPIIITGGNEVNHWNVPKKVLVSNLLRMMEEEGEIGKLSIAPDLSKRDIIVKEMTNFKIKLTASKNEVFEGGHGQHDDLVLSLCLAAFLARRLLLGGN